MSESRDTIEKKKEEWKLERPMCQSVVTENINRVVEGKALTAPLSTLRKNCDFIRVYEYICCDGQKIDDKSYYFYQRQHKGFRRRVCKKCEKKFIADTRFHKVCYKCTSKASRNRINSLRKSYR